MTSALSIARNFRSIQRILAIAVYYCFARYLPPSNVFLGKYWRAFRASLLRRFVDRAGRNLDISRMVYIGSGKNISIGNDSGLGIGADLHGPLTIGNNVMISPSVMIHTTNHTFRDPDIPIGRQGYDTPKPVIVEDDVWIGSRAIILPGVTIGKGSVIGAGAVLTRSVPAYSIAAGNPARIVGSRLGNGASDQG